MDKSTRKSEVLKTKNENVTPPLAIENTQPQPALRNTRVDTHTSVLYAPSSEHTLMSMKTARNFFGIEERPKGDICWKGLPVEKVGDKKIKIVEVV